jgi:Peptidase family M1 domain
MRGMMIRYALLLLSLILTACDPNGVEALPPTPTSIRVIPATLVPTIDRHIQDIPSVVPEVTATSVLTNCLPIDGQNLTRHTVVANLNYAERALVARQNIRYANTADEALSEIVLIVEANQWSGAFTLETVRFGRDSLEVAYELTGRRLTVELPQPLEPECALTLDLVFQLNVPVIGQGMNAFKGFLGHSERQLNLGNWLPVVAPRINGRWIMEEAVLVGEQTVMQAADWDVIVNVSGASDQLQIAGPGDMTHVSPRTWQFILPHSRDFTLSLSEEFQVISQQTANGVQVDVYTFADAQVTTESGSIINSADYALKTAATALAMFSDLYVAYPYPRMVIVQGDFPDGMEFTGLVFVSGDWFRRFVGSPASYLMLITVHEIAHQWWYADVGNNQAQNPWLDEALATYSEYVFIEEYYPDLRDWWWEFRVNAYTPKGFVDSNVYQFASIREYINAIYLLGARMMNDLRDDLGTDAFFDLLRRYAEAGAGQIVTPDLFWSLLTPDQLEATEATRQKYLRQPG